MADTPKPPGRGLLRALLLIFVFLSLWQLFVSAGAKTRHESYDAFMAEVESGKIKKVKVDEREHMLYGERDDKTVVDTPYTGQDNIAEMLRQKKVEVSVVPASRVDPIRIILDFLPWILMAVFMFFIFRSMRNGPNAMAFGKSKAKLSDGTKVKTGFKDVLGADEAVDEVRDIVAFLKDPARFRRTGGRMPKGVLMMGEPGTGKTLLARAIAGEAGVPFFSLSGSDFVEMFVGVGAARVRDLFAIGRKNAPCVIFIDEIDAVGRHRGTGLGGGHDEREQTLNQLLVEMDGFEPNGTIIIAATNRPDVLDPALVRPGRFDRKVVMPRPDVRGRLAILKHDTAGMPLDADVRLETLASLTPGATGADLNEMVNEAALLAGRENSPTIRMDHFNRAYEKKALGAERRGMLIRPEDKRRVCYHEAGHAIATLKRRGAASLHKVTVIPRGIALGVTWSLPEDGAVLKTEAELRAEIQVLLGGRAAEKLIYHGLLSTGASDDLRRATDIQRDMVCRFGMDEDLGPMTYVTDQAPVFLGRDLMEKKNHSEATEREIDLAVRRHLKDAEERVDGLLKDQLKKLEALATALFERETLSRAEIEALFDALDAPPAEPAPAPTP